MTNGPPSAAPDAPPLWQMWRDLADQQARTSQSVADQGARLAAVERSVPELASRLDGRFAALEAQVARTQDHLAQQDQQQAAFRLDMKSTLGTLASGLSVLQQAEQARAQEAEGERRKAEEARAAAAERAAEAQQRAAEQAAETRAETRRWALQTLASAILVVPSIVWPLVVTHPLLWRLGVPAACVALVLLLAALAWLRSR